MLLMNLKLHLCMGMYLHVTRAIVTVYHISLTSGIDVKSSPLIQVSSPGNFHQAILKLTSAVLDQATMPSEQCSGMYLVH